MGFFSYLLVFHAFKDQTQALCMQGKSIIGLYLKALEFVYLVKGRDTGKLNLHTSQAAWKNAEVKFLLLGHLGFLNLNPHITKATRGSLG